jgi:hypothetical protein
MQQEIIGALPGMNSPLAKTLINQAFLKIQNENVFSFQCIIGGWLTPGLLGGSYSGQGPNQSFDAGATFVSPGTITVTPYTNTITGDAVATAAWNGITAPPFLTQQQIRVPYYSLYNIIAQGNNGTVAYATVVTPGSGQTPGTYSLPVSDPTGTGATVSVTVNGNGTVTLPPIVTAAGSGYTAPYITFSEGGTPASFSVALIAVLTIDRMWMEPAQNAGSYAIYMAYFPSPPGWKRWWNIRDTSNDFEMDFSSLTQIDLAREDAERTVFNEPTDVVYYGQDQRPGSATLGQALWELWGHPLSILPYTFACQCNWPPLQNPTDTLPYPLSEELVKERAYEMGCLWEEQNRGNDMERGSGANWMFLAKAHHDEYKDLLRQVRNMDRHIVDLYFTKVRYPLAVGNQDGFATQTGQLNIGTF